MPKVKQASRVVALVLAFTAPTAGAEETSTFGWIEELTAQIIAAVISPVVAPSGAFGMPLADPDSELGEHVPVSGLGNSPSVPAPGLGEHMPVGG